MLDLQELLVLVQCCKETITKIYDNVNRSSEAHIFYIMKSYSVIFEFCISN